MDQRHRAVQIEQDRRARDHNTDQLDDQVLHAHRRNCRQFRADVGAFLPLDRFLHPGLILPDDVVIPDFGNALDILQYHTDHFPVRGKFFVRHLCHALVRPPVDQQKYADSGEGDQPDAPVKNEHEERNDNRCDPALQDHHDGARCDISGLLHRVGGDRRDMPEARIVKISHGKVS